MFEGRAPPLLPHFITRTSVVSLKINKWALSVGWAGWGKEAFVPEMKCRPGQGADLLSQLASIQLHCLNLSVLL